VATRSESGGERPAPPLPPAREKRSRREGLELYSARIPFALKLAAVWAIIGSLLVALFVAADFDTVWMREHAAFIAKGIPDDCDVLAIRWLASRSWRAGALATMRSRSGSSALHVLLRGTP
jgi:hypothetical protein